jgi:uncharacterized protein YndB with AHSA1/START domain
MRIERSIELPATADAVWRVLLDPAQRPRWDVRVADFALDGSPRDGATARLSWRMPVPGAAAECRLVSIEPSTMVMMEVEGAALPIVPPGRLTWRLEPIAAGTRFTSRFEADDADIAGPRWLVAFLLRRDLKRSLSNLRSLILETTTKPTGASVAAASS